MICGSDNVDQSHDFAHHSLFKRVMDTRTFGVGDFTQGPLSGEPIVPFLMPVKNNRGDVIYLIGAGRRLNWLQSLTGDVENELKTSIALLDSQGAMLRTAGHDRTQEKFGVQKINVPPWIWQNDRGNFDARNARNDRVTCGFSHIEPELGNGIVLACAPHDLMLGEVTKVQLTMFGLWIVLLVGLAVAAWMSLRWSVFEPLSKLRLAMHAVSAGERGTRVSLPTSRNEITDVIEGFNHMAESLEERETQFLQSYSEVQRFSYVVSHDLKTPLRGINLITSLLREELGGQATNEVKSHLEHLQDRVNKVLRMISGLRDYFQASGQDFEITMVDSSARIRELLTASEQSSSSNVILSEDLPKLVTSSAAFGLIFRNILDNATRHNDDRNVTISVTARERDAGYVFRVSDDGCGIPADQRAKAFDMLATLQQRDKTKGGGMGLAIVKRAVQRLGGEVWIEDNGDRPGVTFCVALPKQPMAKAS